MPSGTKRLLESRRDVCGSCRLVRMWGFAGVVSRFRSLPRVLATLMIDFRWLTSDETVGGSLLAGILVV